MDDRPARDRFGEPITPPDEGVVLFNPEPKEPLPPEAIPKPPRRFPVGIALGLFAVLAIGGLLVLRWASAGPAEAPPTVPPMVPAVAPRPEETLMPLPAAIVEAAVRDTVTVGVRAYTPEVGILADTLVHFSIDDTVDAVLLRDEARTDEEGLAITRIALPATPASFAVFARLAGAPDSGTTIDVRVRAGAPTTMRAMDGDGQTGAAGELLPSRLAVSVTDRSGNPVAGVEIEFSIRSGEGVRAPSRARTDSLGQASVLWRLGPTEGRQELVANAPAPLRPVIFVATATAAPDATPTVDRASGIEAAPVTVRRSTFVIGGSHVCEIVDGQVECRGANDRGQTNARAGNFTALASGVSHVCGLGRDGAAYCWGANEAGQLGDGTLTDRAAPVPVLTELRFSSLTAGAAHTCGLAGGGIPACWGTNLSGQLGDGSRNDQRGPRAVGGGLSFQTLVAGWNHTCGLTANGNAFCWGLNSQGQLGDGSRLDRLAPTLVRGAVESMVAGSAHTCGLSGGSVLCWGANAFGQLGNGTTDDAAQPVPVAGLPSTATWLAAGAVHTCALVSDGRAFCWGQNLQGQLGDGTTQSRSTPTAVAGNLRFREIYAGGALTCAFTVQGTEYCWGTNSSGQLGDGTRVSRYEPTAVGF